MNDQQKTQSLDVSELEHVAGGEANTCTYASQTYSLGAQIRNPAGGIQTCTSSPNGAYWHTP